MSEEPKPCPFAKGERVIVRRLDAVAGHFARFDTALLGGRAVVELDWMGRWCPIEVALDDLDPMQPRGERRPRRRRRRRNGNES
jgi:hypothetical protein